MSRTSVNSSRPSRTAGRKRKQKKSLPRRLEPLLGLLFLVAVVSLFLGYVTQSSAFTVNRVLFEGAQAVSEDAVRTAAGITTEDNIILLDTQAVARRVEALAYVRRCEVKRMYPDEVLLRIVEREPIANIMVSNHVYEIDREQVVLRELPPHSAYTGPLITNLPDILALEPGVQIESEALAAALALWEAFRSTSFFHTLTLSEISAPHANELRMIFNELPYEMRWGRSDFATQAARLDVLWHETDGDIPCEYYLDLRFDADLICK